MKKVLLLLLATVVWMSCGEGEAFDTAGSESSASTSSAAVDLDKFKSDYCALLDKSIAEQYSKGAEIRDESSEGTYGSCTYAWLVDNRANHYIEILGIEKLDMSYSKSKDPLDVFNNTYRALTDAEAEAFSKQMKEGLKEQGLSDSDSKALGSGVAKGMGQNPYHKIDGLGDAAVWQALNNKRVPGNTITVTVLVGEYVFQATANLFDQEKSLEAAKKVVEAAITKAQ